MKKNIILGLFLILSLLIFSKSVVASTTAAIKDPANIKAAKFQYKKGLEALRTGYYYTSVQHFQKAILLKPHFALAWANMGVALHKLGFPSLGIVSLQQALKYNPNIQWARIKLDKYIASPRR